MLGGPQGAVHRDAKNLIPTGIWSPYCPAHGKSLNWLCYPGPGQTHSTGTIFTYFLSILTLSWFFIFSFPDYSYVPFSHCCELSHLLLPTASRHTAFKYAWNHGGGLNNTKVSDTGNHCRSGPPWQSTCTQGTFRVHLFIYFDWASCTKHIILKKPLKVDNSYSKCLEVLHVVILNSEFTLKCQKCVLHFSCILCNLSPHSCRLKFICAIYFSITYLYMQ